MKNRADVAIIVGSGSDLVLVNETVKTLKELVGLQFRYSLGS